jgi:hypothetical protein
MEDGIVEKVHEICLYFVIVQKTNKGEEPPYVL